MDIPFRSTRRIDRKACLACGVRFAWINLAVAIAMVLLKVSVGILASSQALIASALYSFNDLLAAAAVIVSLKLGGRPADEAHPFGHGKIEFMAIGMVSLVLAASVIMATYSALDLLEGAEGPPSFVALMVAGLSIGTSLLLSKKGLCAAARLNSPALQTSAEHSHVDAVSSTAVAVGLIGAMLGLHWLDRLVAIFEALDIMRLSGMLLGRALKGLMDAALPVEQVEQVRRVCETTPGVAGVSAIRTRRSGRELWVDVVVMVDDSQSVEQAHEVTQRVHRAIRSTLGPTVQSQVAFRARTPLLRAETVSGHA
jgi:cation diffusion facilitator family transporter